MWGRSIWLVAVLCTGACFVDGGGDARECDPGFVPDGNLCVEATGQLDVAWDPQPDCPDGATTTQVISVDGTGTEYYDLFWCDDYSGITGPLPLDDYEVYVNLTDTDELVLFAQSFVQDTELLVPEDTAVLDFDFIADRGFLAASWTVSDSCEGAGITTMELVAGEAVLASAPCTDESLETPPVELGSLEVYLRAVEGDGSTVVGTSTVRSTELEFGNQLVDLGDFPF
ncbi:MAG: hypothetical protein KJO07_02905 [Deltaproteobacteria bacterium]|jgi:hypothetical protein|nr:hypothetical protein [Deltaproteobacteria bacterium]